MALRLWLAVACSLACFSTPMAMRKAKTGAMAGDQSKWCWFSGSSELKDYYFEGMFDRPESDDHTAIQLWRHPDFPKLRIHKVTQWVVRTPPTSDDAHSNLPWVNDVKDPKDMQWLPACMKAGGQEDCSPDDVIEIDLLKTKYISIIPEVNVTDPQTGATEPERGLKIVAEDGSVTEFVGGLYLPRKLMLDAMKRAEEDYGKFSGLGQEARDHANAGDNAADAAFGAWKDSILGSAKTGIGSGAAAGLGVAATLLFAQVPVYGSLVGTVILGAGGGLIGGSAAGLAIGASLGVVVGGGAALYDYHKQKKELALSAVEKIWSKLECHNKMVHCSDTVIVPKDQVCPEA